MFPQSAVAHYKFGVSPYGVL